MADLAVSEPYSYLTGKLSMINEEQDQRVPILQEKTALKSMAEGNVKIAHVLDLPAVAMCCHFNNKGNFLAIGLSNGIIKIYSTETSTFVYNLQDSKLLSLPVTAVKWKKDLNGQDASYHLVATYASGHVRLWHVTSKTCLASYQGGCQLLCAAYSHLGGTYAVGDEHGKITLFDSNSREKMTIFHSSTNGELMDGHVMRVFGLRFHPHDENILVSGGWDNTVQFWDMRMSERHSCRRISGPHICGDALDIEPNTLKIATGSWRKKNTLQIWDYNSGKLLEDLPPDYNPSMLYSVQWKDQETVICGGSHVNMMRLVNITSKQTTGRVVDLEGAVYTIDNNKQSEKSIIAVGSKQHLFIVKET